MRLINIGMKTSMVKAMTPIARRYWGKAKMRALGYAESTLQRGMDRLKRLEGPRPTSAEFRNLMKITHFTQKVSTLIQGLWNKDEIIGSVIDAFAQSGRFSAGILLLTDEGKLTVGGASALHGRVKLLEKVTRMKLQDFVIDQKKIEAYRRVVEEGETVLIRSAEIVEQIFPGKLAVKLVEIIGLGDRLSVATPLVQQGEIIGILNVAVPKMAEDFIPSVQHLATHISAAFERADERARRVEAEEAVRRSEERFRLFFENAPEYCYMVSPVGVILNINKAALEALGYKKGEVVGGILKKIYAPESQSKMKQLFEKWRETGKLKDEEMVVVTKEGDERTVLLSVDAVRNEEGEVLYSISVQRDITERKQTEKALRASEAELNTIMNAARDAIILVDNDGLTRHWNPAAEKIFGRSKAEAIGKDLHELLAPERFLDDYRKGFAGFKRTGTGSAIGRTLELSARHKDEHEFPIELSLSAFVKGEKWQAIGIVRDITERKVAEAALRRSELQQREMETAALAINGIIHALTQYFTALLGWMSLVKGTLEDQECLQRANEAGEGASKYFETFNFFRYGIAKSEKVELKIFVEEAFQKVKGKFADLSAQARLDDLGTIKTSKAALSVILESILTNAFEAIEKNGLVALSLRRTLLGDKEAFEILVVDNGKGIAPEVQDKMFRPFYSTDPDGMALQRGLSLGLVRYVVDKLGGKIEVHSMLGKGAEFKVVLPLEAEES